MRQSLAPCNLDFYQTPCSEVKIAEQARSMVASREKDENYGEGHRERLRERLLDNGGDGLLDHELLEYLLMLAIPRIDTKPIAKQLIAHYGNLSSVFTADVYSLQNQKGIGEKAAAAIKLVQALALRMASEPVREQPILSSWQALLDYLRLDMAHLTIERVRVLYLNSKNMLIRDEVAGEGSIDQAPIYTREIIRRSIDLGAAAIILVHNHPSGDSAPSRQDISMTREIIETGKRLGISVHDHVIVGKDGFSSMRSAGLI
jgi:DNA repair protein RadC